MGTKIKHKNIIIYVTIGIFIVVFSILIPLGFATGYDSSATYFDNTKSSAGGQYLKDAIDEMNDICSKNCPNGKICKSNNPKCIRATTLHTETCSQTSSYCYATGYYATGSKGTTTIVYGNETPIEGVLSTGDAFDCDVNGDGTYDAATERFYYVSDYYDTDTKKFNDTIAVLSYYKLSGDAKYNCNNVNWQGPITAITKLPTTTQWSNIRLYKDSRQIISSSNTNKTTGGTLPSVFSYAGYSARLLTYQETMHGCNDYSVNNREVLTINDYGGLESKCLFLLEKTKFSSKSSYNNIAFLETPNSSSSNSPKMIFSDTRSLYRQNYSSNSSEGIRPVIEIKKSEISY